ncbi:MAG: sodium:panthothenate symporter [Lentisphaeria bacterium]|nr:sodium:panthothenate symporter [Lentisphaeria bacterium]
MSDFLAAGRVCGRYVINMGDAANALSIIALLTYIEIKYQTGFALAFWSNLMAPLGLVLSLTGFITYRFRETKAMSLGQFLEMRYSRKFRIFAAALRSLAEILANMIMPSLAARFFIRMLNLPDRFPFLGMSIPTFEFLMIFFLTLAILLICFGGTLSIIVTDTLQGLVHYPLLVCFVIFLLCKFSWSNEIIPVVQDRAAGESFLNPFDIAKLRDFNMFTMVIVVAFNRIFHAASWIGAGNTTAAKSAHEQKMASILAQWRGALMDIFYMLVAICLITFLNHRHFSKEAAQVRHDLATRVASDVLKDAKYADTLVAVKDTINNIPPMVHEPGVDAPFSQEYNMDTEYLEHIHKTLTADRVNAKKAQLEEQHAGVQLTDAEVEANRKAIIDAEGEANDLFKQCRTLFNQMSLSVTMRSLLPTGLFGAFCLLLFMAMLSTDDSRIFSATLTIAQDCILPFLPKGLTPKQHIWMIRWVAIAIGVFFFFGSKYMSQLDYIQFFVQMATAMWLAGCCPVMVFGLYWKKGTTQAAWTALVTGMLMSFAYILLQRNWADYVYPFLEKADMVEFCDKALHILSAPFGTWIVWKMHPINFPVNSVEFNFFANVSTILLYIVVSYCTCKVPFNMDRMLHRGEYADPNEHKNLSHDWSFKGIFKTIIGITPEYTKGDKVISYALFAHSFIYSFLICFVGVAIYNVYRISRGMGACSVKWWGYYFLVVQLIVPGIIAAITAVWYGIGGFLGIIDLFKTLEKRKNVNELDNGRVEGNVSLGDTIAQEESEKSENK